MSLSESASAQVQAILKAAENSAAEIKREAEAEAEQIRAAARKGKRENLSGVLEQVTKMRSDLDALEKRLREIGKDEPAPEPETAKTTRAPKAPPKVEPRSGDEPDVEGARLIALNMALNGEPREATDKYLAENFDLADRAALLDEVYATVEG